MRAHEIFQAHFVFFLLINKSFMFSFLNELGIYCVAVGGYCHAFFFDSEILKDRDHVHIHLL